MFKYEQLKEGAVLDPRLAHQSRARSLTEWEQAFAARLEAAFAAGHIDPEALAAALRSAGFKRADGSDDWTADSLQSTLRSLNADLDAAYADQGIGA